MSSTSCVENMLVGEIQMIVDRDNLYMIQIGNMTITLPRDKDKVKGGEKMKDPDPFWKYRLMYKKCIQSIKCVFGKHNWAGDVIFRVCTHCLKTRYASQHGTVKIIHERR